MKNNRVYLLHIMDAILRIEEYSAHNAFDQFLDNHLLQDAVVRQIEIIGEATRKLSIEFREQHQTVPWKEMAGMRDKLIHDYMGVDFEEVLFTVQNDIPVLKKMVAAILEAM